jgi:hypothetical protein
VINKNVCVFFCLSSRFGVVIDSNSALIFDFSHSLKRKLNLVGTLGGQKQKIASRKSTRKHPEKVTEKREFLRNIFDKIDFLILL